MAVILPPKIHKPIVFVSSQIIDYEHSESSSLDYFVLMLALIVNNLSGVTDDVIVKIANSVETNHQAELIRDVYKNKEEYAGLIISPTNVELLIRELKEHIKTFEDYQALPLITIDKKIPEPINGILIPGITSNWVDGGARAANAILEFRNKYPKSQDGITTKTLIVPGLTGSEERIKGFTDVMNTHGYYYFRIPSADFTREGAKNAILEFVKTDIAGIDFVFACNDEMALGVMDAVMLLTDEVKNNKFPGVKIVGFDGTKEFTLAMKNNDYLLATVDVNLPAQITSLVSKVTKLFSGENITRNLSEFSVEQNCVIKENPLFKLF